MIYRKWIYRLLDAFLWFVMSIKRPFPSAYQVHLSQPLGGVFWAGPYPTAVSPLITAGITFCIDLTQPGEHGAPPYAPQLPATLAHRRLPIPDMSAPPPQQMVRILDAVDAALAGDHTLYLHCYGGIGRTGTVVGCWLVRHGLRPDAALAQMAEWRDGLPNGRFPAPETAAQRALIYQWQVAQ